MLKFTAMILLPAGFLALASCSSTSQSDDTRIGVILDTVTNTATVQSINAADRTVVLKHPDGTLTTYECGPEVRNFDQIKVGDEVTATLAESVALGLMKGDDVPTGASTATATVGAPLGAKPSGKIVDTTGFIAKVLRVDVEHREVTLQTLDGQTETVKAGPAINLANVKAGDSVGVRITRAFAIAVTTPGTSAP